MPELLGLPYAELRKKLRRWSGVVTVPVLTGDDGRVIGDSTDIARWADEYADVVAWRNALYEAHRPRTT